MNAHILLLLGTIWFGLFSQPEKEILEKVISAPERVEFHGVWQKSFRYRGKWFETEQEIWHQRPNRTEILFLAPAKMEGTVLLKEGSRVVFLPGGKREGVRHIRRYAGGFFGEDVNTRRLDVLAKNYQVELGERQTLLGRQAVEVRIVPRHAHRSRLTLWIDEESGLVLRMEKYGPDGELASKAGFKELAFGLWDDADLGMPTDGARDSTDARHVEVYPDLETFRSQNESPFYLPQTLPRGFVLDRIRTIRKGDRVVHHFVYTDGVSWISLFQRPKGSTDKERAHARADTIEQRGTMLVLHGEVGDFRYALIGEVAADELEAMGASLQPAMGPAAPRSSAGRIALMWIPVVLLLVIFLILRSKREAKHVEMGR